MAGIRGSRGWGHIRRLPSGRFQASYIGPDLRRHVAPMTYSKRTRAEGWLAAERDILESGHWTSPKRRSAVSSAAAMTFGDYASKWIEQRNIKPRTKDGYRSKLRNHIAPTLGALELSAITPEDVRSWYAGLSPANPRANSHAYGLLHAIFAEAVKDGLLQRNPAQISRAMATPRKREPVIITVPEVAKLAEAIEPERFRALILLAAWCGLRWGEATELRRQDFSDDCSVVTVSRGVTRGSSGFVVSSTKSGKGRTVVIPPHIRADLKHHLQVHTAEGSNALLFPNASGGHLNDGWFRVRHFEPAVKAIGRQGLRFHDLRHWHGTQVAKCGTLAESMARLGHSTAKASLIYQHSVSGRDAEIAAALSELAQDGAV